MERVFAIDFGASYTKVALRREAGVDASLLSDRRLNLDSLNICVPSTVVVDESGPQREVICGIRAVDRPAANRVQVFRNWKRHLFSFQSRTPSPLERLLSSDAFRQLADQVGVPESEVASLPARLSLPSSVAEPGDGIEPIYRQIAVDFFRHLRTFTLEWATAQGITDAQRIPARVCIPTLEGHQTINEHPILTILRDAGWGVTSHHSAIAEPYANMIGVVSEGRNRTWEPGNTRSSRGSRIHLGRMIGGPIIRPSTHDYRLFLVDIGTFTTDFAAMTIHGDELDQPPPALNLSIPLGISNLDESVQQCLAPARAQWFRSVASNRREACRRMIYNGQAYSTLAQGVGSIGDSADRGAINEELTQFAERVAEYASEYCFSQQFTEFDEFILTGGGGHIAGIQNRLTAFARERLRPEGRMHLPARAATTHSTNLLPIAPRLVRGATAFGGASVFFEPAYW